MAGHMPLTNGATAAKEAGYRTGKSKKNPEMATDAADTSAGRSPKRRAAKSDSRPNRMRPAGTVVSDNGIGIAKDFLPKVFEIFTQEHEENTRVYGGSGLGLSIARNYARMMDGDITVESAEGKGTVFTVTAKLDFDRRKKARKERTENISFEGKRILLVEDHPLNVIVAKGLLEKKQFEVVTAENGKKAVELVTDAPEYYFDAILMDIRMPVLDGIEAARQIRALDRADVKELPIIAMTANAGDEDRRQTKEAGMSEHLAKPIDPKLLYTTLQKFILP